MVRTAFIILMVTITLSAAGQKLEFRGLRKLPASVNSNAEESLPLLSPDGRQLFFSRALHTSNIGGKFSGVDVWYADATGSSWKPASNNLPGSINDTGHNVLVGMSSDGKKRYFLSVLPNQKVQGIWSASKASNWSRPEFIPVPGIENQNFLGVFVSPDLDVMIFSMKGEDSRGEEDLYFSAKSKSGQWSRPRNMGATINSSGFEISPFLSADKKRLYFSSNGHGGEGDADIFYSERLYDSWETWSVPVNLGAGVNSKKFDAYFSLYGDSIAYFSSNRDGRFADLYEVKVGHSRTVLKEGQRYLSKAEWNRELGGTVSNEVIFSPRNVALNASQKELLFYIANKLQLQKDIIFHLVVVEEDNKDFSTKRLEAISSHLNQSGIDEERIIVEQVEAPRQSRTGKIEIRLIE